MIKRMVQAAKVSGFGKKGVNKAMKGLKTLGK